MEGWQMQQIDIHNVFLEDIYMDLPQGCKFLVVLLWKTKVSSCKVRVFFYAKGS